MPMPRPACKYESEEKLFQQSYGWHPSALIPRSHRVRLGLFSATTSACYCQWSVDGDGDHRYVLSLVLLSQRSVVCCMYVREVVLIILTSLQKTHILPLQRYRTMREAFLMRPVVKSKPWGPFPLEEFSGTLPLLLKGVISQITSAYCLQQNAPTAAPLSHYIRHSTFHTVHFQSTPRPRCSTPRTEH